ncbi:transglutaminase family protein [Flavobacterium sp. NRK1]|uniref:transglutaminase-like domain-containing protein n=1 Tax=Flavobacterium sp. NRK1 TaxID=2954929 RepID=UPI002093129C|nr:transglutaminase-like domain-containing protein [Flavobacterium sp. NRK1]MCO6148530.1 transglutaminase-like domain-containing protein [Flavobacterium sp. NRK1]
MKRIHFTIILLVTALQFVTAQKNIDPTPEDIALAKKLRDKYTKDDVVILNGSEKVTFDFKDNVTVKHSIEEKMMNINHRADIQKYEFYDSESELEDFKIKYRNDKAAGFAVKDEFYKSDDLFFNDYRVKYMNVDFPVQGYTYNYELTKNYKDVKYFTTLYFHDTYPTLKKEFTIVVPDWLEIEIKEFNFQGFDIKKTQKTDAKSKSTIYTYTLENTDAIAKDDNAPGMSYYYPHLLVIAKSYTRNNTKTTLFNSTADLYKWYKSLVDSMDENPSALKDKVNELTANAKTDEEKIKNIYYWVQDNIRYIAFEDGLAGFKPDASQNVFQKRYGDCKGMANLTRQMLKEAGFDARLTWIGTKHIAYNYSIPSLVVDNHMICTLFKDGKKYFLDGTEKYNSFGEYADRIQGKEVMIEDGDKFIIEKVPVLTASANKEIYTSTFHVEDEALVGKVSGNMKGESRASFLYGYNNIRKDKKENALQYYISRGDKNFSVSNIITSDLTDRDKTLTMEYNANLKNRVSSFDNEMYVDLDYMEEFSNLDFKERKRDYEFSFKKDYESVITLEIPAGYKVSRLPESYTAKNDAYSMNISYEQKGNTIVYKKRFTINNGTIKKADFQNWNQSIESLKKLYNDQITLTKS